MDNPVFGKEPFTERTAWIWLIEEAAWKTARRRVGAVIVDVQRGQLAASVRFLAEAWGWSKSRVERFLGRLTNEQMIGTHAGTGVTIITICNYDKYQAGPDIGETPTETEARQDRDSSGTNKNEVNEVKNLSLEFDAWWQLCPRKVSKGQAQKAFRRARATTDLQTLIAGMKRYAADMAGQDPQFIKHPGTWLNGQCWLDEPAKRGGAKTHAEQKSKPVAVGSPEWHQMQKDYGLA
jgi:hypothetical protein